MGTWSLQLFYTASCGALLVLFLSNISDIWLKIGDGEQVDTPSAEIKYPRLKAQTRNVTAHVWTLSELAAHDGHDANRPLLLAIIGEVFDVGPGARFYSPGASYSSFAGRDNSRGFASGSDGLPTADLQGLSPAEVQPILDWRNFYRAHEEYRFVGYLEGHFYDAQGKAKPELTQVEAMHDAQQRMDRIIQDLSAQFPSCNSRVESAKPYFELWCDDGYHTPGSWPIHFFYTVPAFGEGPAHGADRCACVTSETRSAANLESSANSSARPGIHRARLSFVEYPECQVGKQLCRRPKGAPKPS